MQTDSADIIQFVNIFSAGNGNVNSARPLILKDEYHQLHFLPVSYSYHCLSCSWLVPVFQFLFQGTGQLFISTFHSVFFTDSLLRLTLLVSEFICFLPIFSQCCLCPLSPISESLWSVNLNLTHPQDPQILTMSYNLIQSSLVSKSH